MFDFVHAGRRRTVSIGRFEDGRTAELFIDAEGCSPLGGLAQASAIVASLALQSGCALERVKGADYDDIDDDRRILDGQEDELRARRRLCGARMSSQRLKAAAAALRTCRQYLRVASVSRTPGRSHCG